MEAFLTVLIIAVIFAVLFFVGLVLFILLNPVKEIDWSNEVDLTPYEDDDNVRLS